jgi:D-amino peptidase
MTGDVNAAIRGAFAGGASAVSVTDGHHAGRNILIEELDSRAVLNSGGPAPLSMVQGVDQDVQGVMLVGYHARMGTPRGILDHTWNDSTLANLWINGRLFGESGLNGAVCGHFGVPVIMISGDQTLCAEARDFFGDLETVIVKQAVGRMAAECLPPAVTAQGIEEAAQRAVRRLAAGNAPAPLKIAGPVSLVLELGQSEMADRAMLMPGAARLEDRKVQYVAPDMHAAYLAFRSLLALAG